MAGYIDDDDKSSIPQRIFMVSTWSVKKMWVGIDRSTITENVTTSVGCYWNAIRRSSCKSRHVPPLIDVNLSKASFL